MNQVAEWDATFLKGLPRVPFVDFPALPSMSGVYFCLSGDNLVLYIGQARSLYARWNAKRAYPQTPDELFLFGDRRPHHKQAALQQAGCTVIAYVVLPKASEAHLTFFETLCIARYSPLLNRARGRPKKREGSVKKFPDKRCTTETTTTIDY